MLLKIIISGVFLTEVWLCLVSNHFLSQELK